MIAAKFYSTISVCSACKGWGTLNVPPKNYKDLCSECSGEGVAVFQSDKTYLWEAPSFVDYKGRAKIRTLKILIYSFLAFLILAIFWMVQMFMASIFAI